MGKKLKVTLPSGWLDETLNNPRGGPTYVRELSEVPGALQMTLTFHKTGTIPNPSEAALTEMAKELGLEKTAGELIESSCGQCAAGHYGTAVFRSSEFSRTQIWYLSNGRDFALVTHIFSGIPDPVEIVEAQEIVRCIQITDQPMKRKWWKLWG